MGARAAGSQHRGVAEPGQRGPAAGAVLTLLYNNVSLVVCVTVGHFKLVSEKSIGTDFQKNGTCLVSQE